MSGGPTWTEAEDDLLRGMSPRSYYAMVAGTDRERGLSAIKARKTALNQIGATKKPDRPQTVRHPAVEATGGIDESVPLFSVPTVSGNKPARYSKNTPQTEITRTFQDKRTPSLTLDDHLDFVETVQQYRHRAGRSQDYGAVQINTDRPVCVLVLSDTHLGSVGSEVETFRRITREIQTIDELYVILAGDLLNMAIQMKHGVGAMYEDVLTAEQQIDLLDQWLDTIQHKVLAACWDNHVEERQSKAVGYSSFARMMGQRFIYHSGIGHLSIGVGQESYAWAVSHRFRGRSQLNPCHAQMQYVRYQAPDREIVAAGDSHVPGYAWFTHGGEPKLALNAGTLHTGSRYAKRYFSLTTSTAFPCVALWPDEHRFVAHPSVADWLAR